jgi:hypothetical protein
MCQPEQFSKSEQRRPQTAATSLFWRLTNRARNYADEIGLKTSRLISAPILKVSS